MKTYKGFLPQPADAEFQLGDYGYFDGSVWCRMGNIRDLSEVRLKVEDTRSGLFSDISSGVQCDVDIQGQVNTAGNGLYTSITFTKKDGYLQKANIHHFSRYASIPELDRLLKILLKKKVWRPEYKLIVCVAYASSFLTILSRCENAMAQVNGDIKSREIHEGIKVDGGIKVSGNSDEISVIIKPEDGNLHVSSARFVHLTRKIPMIGSLGTKYLGPYKEGYEIECPPDSFMISPVNELN